MGGVTFLVLAKGKSAGEAFCNAVEQAAHDHGHAGYTGTIAEKDEFVMISCGSGLGRCDHQAAVDHARKLIDADDRRIVDKWGPAGCISLGDHEYLFFGWASS